MKQLRYYPDHEKENALAVNIPGDEPLHLREALRLLVIGMLKLEQIPGFDENTHVTLELRLEATIKKRGKAADILAELEAGSG